MNRNCIVFSQSDRNNPVFTHYLKIRSKGLHDDTITYFYNSNNSLIMTMIFIRISFSYYLNSVIPGKMNRRHSRMFYVC